MTGLKGAAYINPVEQPKVRSLKTRIAKITAGAAATLTVLLSVGAGALALDSNQARSVVTAEAGLGISCPTVIGADMEKRRQWGAGNISPRIYENLSGRTFTLNEIISHPRWTNYTGIGNGSEADIFVKPYKDVLDQLNLNGGAFDDGTGSAQEGTSDRPGEPLSAKYATNWGEVEGKLKDERNTGTCFWEQTFLTANANTFGMELAHTLQLFVSWVATSAFNTSFICDPDDPTGEGCIDLVKIIGGRDDASYRSGGEGGIIGDLTNSIYKPLVLIVVVITALGVAYTGLVKRKFREALTQTAWLVVSFVIGLAILLNPSMLARAPMIATNAITGCVIGSFNGVNCFSGAGFSTNTQAGPVNADQGVCISEARVERSDQITGLAVNSMGCTIWKTFVLQNYARGAFGVNLNQLETTNPDTVAGKAALKAGVPGTNFCYTLSSSGSIKDYDGNWLQTNDSGAKICNLAVYNILMQMKVTPAGMNAANVPENYDPAWYDLVVTTASSDKLWANWAFGGFQSSQGFVAVLSVILGGVLITVVSVSALMYYISGVVLLLFGPLFILVGIHPGRGKKLMLGWLETILASMLKYLASALFLLVALALYSSVLGAADPLAALLFVTVLSMVLWMYRKDIIDTFSKVNLGGERLANVLDKQIPILGASGRQIKDKAAKMPSSIIGGAVGGFMAGGVDKMREGAKIATQNELRSAPGLLGRAAQARERQMRDNKADFGRDTAAAKETANRAGASAEAAEREQSFAQNRENLARNDVDTAEAALESAEDLHENIQGAVVVARDEVSVAQSELDTQDLAAELHKTAMAVAATKAAGVGISPAVAEFRKLQLEIEQLGAHANLAQLQGEPRLAESLIAEQKALIGQQSDLKQQETSTLRGAREWSVHNSRFDSVLEHEQKQHEELLDESGNVKAYSPGEHVAAGNNLENAKQKSIDLMNDLQTAGEGIDKANEVVVKANIAYTEAKDDTAVKTTLAKEARVEAAALNANADAMFQMNQDLGPGNMPTVADRERMTAEAYAAGEKVREAYKNIDAAVDPTVAAPAPVQPGAKPTFDNAAQEAEERARESQQAQERARNAEAEAKARQEELAIADRKATAATYQTDQANRDARTAEQYAAPHRERLDKVAAQLEKLEKALESGSLVKDSSGKLLTTDESARLLQEKKAEVEAKLKTIEAEGEATVTRATKAAEEARAKEAERVQAEAEYKAAREEKKAAEKAEAKANKDRKSAERDESRAQREKDAQGENRSRESGVLTKGQVKMVENPRSANDHIHNKTLDKLVTLAEQLAKTPANNANRASVAKLHEQINKVAANVDMNPKANEGILKALSDAVNSLTNGTP